MAKILEVKHLNYRDWEDINLSFRNSKMYYVVGCNNSGKTTLFKLLSGLIKTSNCVCCDDILYNENNREDFIKKLGVVRRVDNNSFIYKSVIDEMTYPLYNLNYHKQAITSKINSILSFFEMETMKKKNIVDLDMYEKQILLIMISLLHHPQVLLLDNVLELLPEDKRFFVLKKLKLLSDEGLCIINFTSDLTDFLIADKIILLKDFKVLKEIEPMDLFKDDKLLYENGLEVPFICDLNIKLKMYKLIDKDYLDMKEMVDKIWQ